MKVVVEANWSWITQLVDTSLFFFFYIIESTIFTKYVIRRGYREEVDACINSE